MQAWRKELCDEMTALPARAVDRTDEQEDQMMAVVGAINELVLENIEQERVGRLRELVAPASELVRAIIGVE